MSLVLAIDIGTSSLRTALFSAAGDRLVQTTSQQAYNLSFTEDGGAELPTAALRKALYEALDRTLAVYRADKVLRATPLLAVGTSCFWHSLIGLDQAGRPVTPVYTWADSRCQEDARTLRDEMPERKIHRRTGCMLRSSFWPAKLLWLRRVKRDKGVNKWVSPAEWLYEDMLGAANCGFSMASGTGLFNPASLAWDDELLSRCGINAAMLNPVSETPGAFAGKSARFAELRGIPWFPAIGDGAAGNLGCGATKPGLAALNVGTSAALRMMDSGEKVEAPFGLFCYRLDRQRFVVGGAVSNAGNLRAWCVREMRLDGDLERELERRPVPEHGLTVQPYWSAERAPTWEEDKRGSITGITHKTTALDILQAMIEASYMRVAAISEMIIAHAGTAPKFIVSGGIQHSPSSVQRLANVLNQPLYLNQEPEASLRGAAVNVLNRLGMAVSEFKFRSPVRPIRKAADAYAALRQTES